MCAPGRRRAGRPAWAAGSGPLDEGSVGAGTGATVAKARGMGAAVKSGIGSASLKLPGGPVVAAAVAVNAYGGVFDHHTGLLLAGPRKEDGTGFDDPVAASLRGGAPSRGARLGNTTIGVVATDAPLNKEEANYLASVSHDGLALTVRPCHTIFDGDTMFALATGTSSEPVELTRLGVAAVEVTAEAVVRAVKTATGLGGVPAVSEVVRG